MQIERQAFEQSREQVRTHPMGWSGVLAVAAAWSAWVVLKVLGHSYHIGNGVLITAAMGSVIFLLMLGCVMVVVRHADHLADSLREPYGTLVLTLAATIIEVSLLLRVMFHGLENPTLLRDTVFAVLMISMNFTVGLALVAGGWRHVEQSYNLRGAISFVQLIAPLSLLMLVMPDYTTSSSNASLVPAQEAYLGILTVVVYLLFLWVQTGRHRSYFDHTDVTTALEQNHAPQPMSLAEMLLTIGGLAIALLPMVLLSEFLGEAISFGIEELQLPTAIGGLLIASLGLIPEITSTLKAALANQVQRSVNICLGSSLATIGMTVPSVMLMAAYMNMDLELGLSGTNKTLLTATLLVTILTFVSGAANMLQGIVHILLFLGYVIFILFP